MEAENLTTENIIGFDNLTGVSSVNDSDELLIDQSGSMKKVTVGELLENTQSKITEESKLSQDLINNLPTDLENKVTKNNPITGSTKCKITYDEKGLVTSGSDLSESDIPELPQSKITNLSNDLSNKVDKEIGKSLVSDSDITQITTNKTNITNLQTTVGNNSSGLVKQVSDLESVVGNVNDLLSSI